MICDSGGEFLQRFARVQASDGPGKCAFCLTRDGRAVKVQRTIFSECFYVMATDELSRVTGDKAMQVEMGFKVHGRSERFDKHIMSRCRVKEKRLQEHIHEIVVIYYEVCVLLLE